mgnify:CR=1 FL=1
MSVAVSARVATTSARGLHDTVTDFLADGSKVRCTARILPRAPLKWAGTQLSLSLAQLQIAMRTRVRAQLPELCAAAVEARQAVVDGANAPLVSWADYVLEQFDQ